MALARAVPERFEIISQFNLPKGPEGPAWAHPVIHGGRLYLRHGDWLYAHDIRPARSAAQPRSPKAAAGGLQ